MSVGIAFDLRALQDGFKAHKKRGIGVYSRNIISRLKLAPPHLDIKTFHDPALESQEAESYGSLPFPVPPMEFLTPLIRPYFRTHLLYKYSLQNSMRKSGANLLFFPSHLDVPFGMRGPFAVTAHDIIQIALKGENNTVKRKVDFIRQRAVLKNAALVISVSEHTKNDLVNHVGLDPEKVVVVPNGVAPQFCQITPDQDADANLPEKFILNVGGIDKRKNITLLFSAFSYLLEHEPDYHLVMTGEIENDPQYKSFKDRLTSMGLGSRVLPMGFVETKTLVALYNRATVFFYPSLYEGFGLPVLEAMACGAPVISTNRSSIPEVAGDAALLLDPDNSRPFCDALLRLCRSSQERDKMKSAGLDRVKLFSWDRCAKETLEALYKVASQ